MKRNNVLVLCVYPLLVLLSAGCHSHPTAAPAPIGLVGSSKRLAGQPEPRFAHLTQAQTASLTPAEKADLASDAARIDYYSIARNCSTALRTNPNDVDAHFGLGMYYMSHHRNRPQAVQEFRAVVKAQPDNRFASLLLARSLMTSGHKTEAAAIDGKLAATPDDTGLAARKDLVWLKTH